MKALHSIAVIIILISTTFSQENKDDWPNLKRYQSDNKNVNVYYQGCSDKGFCYPIQNLKN